MTGEVLELYQQAGYAYASVLRTEGRREEAAVQYASLGRYKDAEEQALMIEYQLALDDMEQAPEEMEPFNAGLNQEE